jgi:hypothetical protein
MQGTSDSHNRALGSQLVSGEMPQTAIATMIEGLSKLTRDYLKSD